MFAITISSACDLKWPRFMIFSTIMYLVLSAILVDSLSTPNNVSPVASNFYRMVNRFKTYTNQDISSLESDRLQHLVLGGREALTEVKVINSFAVLYEDVLPVRFGGDILFNMLEKAINNAKKKRGNDNNTTDDVKGNEAATAISKTNTKASNKDTKLNSQSRKVIKDVLSLFLDQQSSTTAATCDGLFAEIDRDQDGSVTLEEFTNWILSVPMTALELQEAQNNNTSNSESNTENDFNDDNSINKNIDIVNSVIDSGKMNLGLNATNINNNIPTPKVIFEEIDTDNSGSLSRDEFQVWTTLYLRSDNDDDTNEDEDGCEVNYDQPISVNGVRADTCLEDIPLTSERNKKHRERYLNMVKSFSIWGEKINLDTSSSSSVNKNNNSENRIQIIIDGCFAGAKNTGVVKALGILYEDYMPLRVAGDVVFKLVEKAVG